MLSSLLVERHPVAGFDLPLELCDLPERRDRDRAAKLRPARNRLPLAVDRQPAAKSVAAVEGAEVDPTAAVGLGGKHGGDDIVRVAVLGREARDTVELVYELHRARIDADVRPETRRAAPLRASRPDLRPDGR